MSQYITKIRTNEGDKQIDYNALANLPSNPNLLINSDFRNPINQRGQITYSNNNDWAWCYGIDRWACNASLNSCTLTVNDASITITNNGNSSMHFRQLFEQVYDEGLYTATINIVAVTGNVVVHFDDGVKSSALAVGKNVVTLNAAPEYLNLLIDAGASIELAWIKLEAGSVSTSFVPKQYAEELMICRRYFCVVVPSLMIIARQRYDGFVSYFAGFPYPNVMRTEPNVTYDSKTSDGSEVLTGKLGLTCDEFCAKYFSIEGNYDDVELTYMSLDAEIY